MIGPDLSVGDWLAMCALGAFVGLDGISWPQVMWSRPIVAATLGGALFGDARSGFVVGLWLELLFSRHPPYGAARYPEAGPAALIAGATVASAGGASTAVLSGSVLVGWTVGWIGMHSIGVARRLNARLVADPGALGGSPTELGRRHLACLGFDATRAAALVATLLVPAVLGVRVLAELDVGTAASASSTSLLAAVGIAGLTGVGARALGARRNGWPIVLGGAGVGAVLAWWLG